MTTAKLLKERLATAFEQHGSQAAFAKAAGIPKDTFSKYLAGSQPGPAALIKMADAASVSLDYLLGRDAASGNQVSDPATRTTLPNDFIPIRQLEVRASAGPGRAVVPAGEGGPAEVAFRESWLRTLGVVPRNAEFLQAQGDSMEPTICDGDLMLVDRGYGEVRNGKIYVLVVNGLVLVKRVQLLAVGGLMLISDNQRYPAETIAAGDVADLSIEARVAWYGRAI